MQLHIKNQKFQNETVHNEIIVSDETIKAVKNGFLKRGINTETSKTKAALQKYS